MFTVSTTNILSVQTDSQHALMHMISGLLHAHSDFKIEWKVDGTGPAKATLLCANSPSNIEIIDTVRMNEDVREYVAIADRDTAPSYPKPRKGGRRR